MFLLLNRVTFTGVDDRTNVNDLVDLTKRFPFVEFGVLISKGNTNRSVVNRYPNATIFKKLKNKGLNLSCHLCGSVARNIVKKDDWNEFFDLLGKDYEIFNRFQLNVSGLKGFSRDIHFIEDKDYGQCLGGAYWSDLRVFHSNYQKGTDLELIKKHRKVVQRIKKTWLEGRHIYAHKYTFYVTPIIADICSCQLFCKPNTTLYYIVRKGEFQIDNNFWKTKEWNTYVKYIDFSSLDYMLHQPVPPHIYHR